MKVITRKFKDLPARRERARLLTLSHGMAARGKKAPEYICWQNMRRRCYDISNKSYPRYGGRGIKVCDRWHKFENFYEDMGERPTPDHSIDRIDNNGNYEAGNCRWTTRVVQNNNH